MWLFRAWLQGDIKASPRLAEIFFSCASCGNCKEQCVMEFRDQLVEIFNDARRRLVEDGLAPPPVRDYFKSMHLNGNPYRLAKEEKNTWAEGLGIEPYGNQEYLFFVGDVGALDEKGKRMAQSAASALRKAGFDFGILGSRESPDGNDVRVMGEVGLFELFVRENLATFKEAGVEKIIALSPHSYNVFRNEYPACGGDFQVMHYTQALAQAVSQGRLSPGRFEQTVTYQDPCYLGRHNLEYEAPRRILQSIPGLVFREMEGTMRDSACCGGGGGNIFTDILGQGPDAPARVRVREAAETGASVLSVACPACARMLDDAAKAEGLEDSLAVMDVAEIVETSLRAH
jgi:Fe-S oxidoreductase